MTEVIDSGGGLVPLAPRAGNHHLDWVRGDVEKISESSVRMTIRPESRVTKNGIKQVRMETKSQVPGTNGRPRNGKGIQIRGAAYSVEEFEKKAREKVIEDSIRKRERLLAMKNRKSFHEQGRVSPAMHRPHSTFQGVEQNSENGHLFKADNITHLSFMVHRLIKTHKISSVIDVPCTSSTIWMPELLKILEFEVPRFHYRCVVPDDEYLINGILQYKEYSSATVVKDPVAWASKLPKADLAFVWYGFGYLSPQRAWKLIKSLRKSKTKYVIVPNFPDVKHNPGSASKSGRVNVRRAPYRFDEPLRVVNDMSGDPSVRKQLFLYDLNNIRAGAL
ncbi:unnamed protein product [Agarophyton chilense]